MPNLGSQTFALQPAVSQEPSAERSNENRSGTDKQAGEQNESGDHHAPNDGRLEELYGDRHRLDLERVPTGGVRVVLSLPWSTSTSCHGE